MVGVGSATAGGTRFYRGEQVLLPRNTFTISKLSVILDSLSTQRVVAVAVVIFPVMAMEDITGCGLHGVAAFDSATTYAPRSAASAPLERLGGRRAKRGRKFL